MATSRPKVVLVTSPSGSGRDEYLAEFQGILTDDQRKQLHIDRLRDDILKLYEEKGVTTGVTQILDLDDTTRRSYRSQAIDGIMRRWQSGGYQIVSTPHPILWRSGDKDGLELADVEKLNPDMFVVIVDDVIRTRETLKKDSQFKSHTYSLKDLAQWRGRAIDAARKFATSFRKPFYLIARDHPPEVLRDLIFNPEKGRAYFSYPITNMSAKDIGKAKKFMTKLRQHYVFFDPLTIQDHAIIFAAKPSARTRGRRALTHTIKYRSGRKVFRCSIKEILEAEEALDTQVVERDFRLIDQSEVVIVYYPIKELAAGVICEMFYGTLMTSKRVYAWHPHTPSPFFKYLCMDRKVFSDVSEFSKVLTSIEVSRPRVNSWGEKI